MQAERSRRRARVALVSAALVVLTLAGHSAASGRLPGLLSVAIVVGTATMLTAAATARRVSPTWLAAYLIGGQALLHVLLAMSDAHGHATTLIPSPLMLAAHGAAAIGAALVLVEADALIGRWAGLVGQVFGIDRAIEIGTPRVRVSHRATNVDVPGVLPTLLNAVVRRGPPARPGLVT